MRTKYIYPIFLIIALISFGCIKEKDNIAPDALLRITPTLSPEHTKALINDANITAKEIGLQITNSEGTSLYDNQSGNNNQKLMNKTIFGNIYLSSSPAKIYAYCPFTSTAGNIEGTGELFKLLLNIPATQSMADQTDYLWAAQDKTIFGGANNISNSNAAVQLKMNHALAQVAFVFYKENYTDAASVSQLEIKHTSASPFIINKSGTNDLKMRVANGTISGGQVSSSLIVNNIVKTINQSTDPGINPTVLDAMADVYALAVPVSIPVPTNLHFIFTIDGNPYEAPLSTGPDKWEGGKKYIYKIKLKGTKLSVESLTVTSWTTSEDVPLGSEVGVAPPSNCYMLAPGGSVVIPVGIKGNGNAASATLGDISPTHTAQSVGILWQTASGLVKLNEFNSSLQTVAVTASLTPSTGGNAVIAAYSGAEGTGTILWSWHIWVTSTPNGENVNNNYWMDRNLGATAIATNNSTSPYNFSGGLFYQWGRKDPFPGSNGLATGYASSISVSGFVMPSYSDVNESVVKGPLEGDPQDQYVRKAEVNSAEIPYSSQLAFSIKYPLLFLGQWGGSTAKDVAAYTQDGGMRSWGGEFGDAKSIYDPCPTGWRVPNGRSLSVAFASPWSTWIGAQTFTNSTFVALLWKNGSTAQNTFYYPLAGLRNSDTGAIFSVGGDGTYWTASAKPSAADAYFLGFNNGGLSVSNQGSRAKGMSVRCVKDL